MGERVPVILSAGSYFGHSGEISEGRATRTPARPTGSATSSRASTCSTAATPLVLVDTRGYGGSTGCLDFAGPGEQADVAAAIDWAADQSWSTGAVGMYGKSYDAVTGLIGNNLDQDALKAVVAQEPIWDMYDRVRSHGVPRQEGGIIRPDTYNTIAPGSRSSRTTTSATWPTPRYELAHPEVPRGQHGEQPEGRPGARATGRTGTWRSTPRGATPRCSSPRASWSGTPGPRAWPSTSPTTTARSAAGSARGTTCGATTAPRTAPCRWAARAGSTRYGAFYDEHLKDVEPTGRPTPRSRSRTAPAPGAPRTRGRPRTVTATVALGAGSYVDDGGPPRPRYGGGLPTPVELVHLVRARRAGPRVIGTPRVALDARGTATSASSSTTSPRTAPPSCSSSRPRSSLGAGDPGARVHRLGPGRRPPSGREDRLDQARATRRLARHALRRDGHDHDARLELALDDPAGDTPSEAGAPSGWTATWPRTRVR